MPLSKKRKLKHFFYPVLLAGTTFLITLTAAYFLSQNLKRHEKDRFDNMVFQIEQQIIFRMQTYINALEQTRSMFEISEKITREEFHRYIDSLEILKDYPGIQAIGYTLKTPKSGLQKLISQTKTEGHPDFKIWPDFSRDIYYPIIFIEPFDWRNKRAFGYDMHTDPTRRAAMDLAMQTGEPAASARVKLVQEVNEEVQPGFIIYSPVYRMGSTHATPEERTRNLMGFIHAPFRAYDLFNEIFSHLGRDIPLQVEIYFEEDQQKQPMYGLNEKVKPDKKSVQFEKHLILPIAQREWKISIRTLPNFSDQTASAIPFVVLVLGTIVSFLIFWIILRQIEFSSRENARAAQLEILNSVGRRLSGELELPKLIQYVTDAGRVITDSRWGAYFTRTKNDSGAYELSTVSGGKENEFKEILQSLDPSFFKQHFDSKNTITDNYIHDNSPLKSFLAVAVVSRTGEVIGGLLYGDSKERHFGERDKKIIEGIAAQAAIAIDNAHLFKSATDAIKVRDEFLSVASHELKTPITSLKLQFQQAARSINNGNPTVYEKEAVNRRVKKAVQQLDRMNSLIEDMLDASRASLSKMTLNKVKFDLNTLTSEIIDSFAEQLTVQKIPYTFIKSPQPAYICGDSYRIEQLISNLISNAIKYGNGSAIEIVIKETGPNISLSVTDHGIGIARDKLDKIFERYERAVTGSNISGLGLGLYISSHIARSHNGKIEVQSQYGEGSTFTFIVPKTSPPASGQ